MILQGNYKNKIFFTAELLKWNMLHNNRLMPWKNENDPYKIWISEIILQQTRVQQGIGYYNRFIKAFPAVQNIADANEQQVFKLWEGLGYYSRCKNIIASAKYITNELSGIFPVTFEEILKLKGVGNYTASAIASFAFNLPYAVLDGNVFRILSRFFGISTPVDSTLGKNIFNSLANELLQKGTPGIYNQAIMDFGATICRPKPLCEICPLQKKCVAFINDKVNVLPVKEKIITRKYRWLYYLIITFDNKIFVKKRVANDIWQNLNEFVLIETKNQVSISTLQNSEEFKNIFNPNSFKITSISKIYKQKLTHQTITGRFMRIDVKIKPNLPGYHLMTVKKMSALPFPKFITTYLKD